MLWLGKKIFRLREKLTIGRGLMAEDEEKPFLEHLEDLRHALMRIITTLVIAMVLCFTFKDTLVDVIMYPIQSARIGWPHSDTLPTGLKPQDWIVVKKITRGWLDLPADRHQAWISQVAGDQASSLAPHAEGLLYYSEALLLPEARREAFLREALAQNPPALESALQMVSRKPDARLDSAIVERGGDMINMQTFSPAEAFNITIKLSLYAGVIISFPFLLYFLLTFILPGLKKEERKVLWPSLAIGFGLFLVGVSFAYFIILPKALAFFYSYTRDLGWSADYRFREYSSFVTQLTLIFGLGFELPVVIYALIRLGLLSFSTMRRTRAYAILIIAIVSAVITPTPDAGTMLALTVPLVCLYEICIWLAYFHERAEKKREAAEEAERRARRERANLASAYTPDSPQGESAVSPAASDSHPSPDADSRSDAPHESLADSVSEPDAAAIEAESVAAASEDLSAGRSPPLTSADDTSPAPQTPPPGLPYEELASPPPDPADLPHRSDEEAAADLRSDAPGTERGDKETTEVDRKPPDQPIPPGGDRADRGN
jgi:sec-independent protein translocase protein TatC